MKSITLLLFLSIVAADCGASTQYVVVNNNGVPNSATIYSLDQTHGMLTEVTTLKSSGNGGGVGPPSASNVMQAINSAGTCVYITNYGTNDISAFSKAINYREVGRYKNGDLGYESQAGGSLSLTPNGRFLYATYSETENVGAWSVNSDCSLTLIGIYVPSGGTEPLVNLQVTPNGSFLVLPLAGQPYAELFTIDSGSGQLTDKGYLDFRSLAGCQTGGCAFDGLDITKDSKVVLFAGATNGKPSVFAAQITPNGLVNPRRAFLMSQEYVTGPRMLVMSKAAYSGSGLVYISCFGGRGFPGIITASFTENPPNLSLLNETLIDTGAEGIGPLAVVGDLLILDNMPNMLQVYSINADGTVDLTSTTTDSNAEYPSSLSAVPNNR